MNEILKSYAQQELPNFKDSLEDISETLPYSDIKQRWIPENSIYENSFHHLPLGRLTGIKALSFLSYVGPNPETTIFTQYQHDRLDHSLVVALLSEHIATKNGLPQEQVNLITLASLLHDIATPAHGDMTKKVDPEFLDEEKYWYETLDQKGIDYLKTYGGNKENLSDIISNKGILGQVLDIADRITYTMKDLHSILGMVRPEDLSSEQYFFPLHHIIDIDPEIGNIYQEIGVDQKKEKVFFNNPQRLDRFLALRASLHKNLYINPISQGRDLFVSKLIAPLYSRNDESFILTPSKLRSMTDEELTRILSDDIHERYKGKLNFPNLNFILYHKMVNWHPKYEKFDNLTMAEKRADELSKDKKIAVVGINKCKGFNPGTSYDVATPSGEILPFKEYMPVQANRIETVSESTKGIFVLYSDISDNENPINSLLKAALKPGNNKIKN